jgi:hypothetical protein
LYSRRTIDAVSRGIAAAGLFVAVWLCYLPGNMGCADSMWAIPTAVSLIEHGDRDLDEYLPVLEQRRFAFTELVGGHRYTMYPVGASLVAMPAVVVLQPIAAAIVRDAPAVWERILTHERERGCQPGKSAPLVEASSTTEHVIASAIVAATAVIVFMIGSRELPSGAAAAMALVFAFATPAWSSASRLLWQHGPSMLLLSVALWLQVGGARLFWVGLVLGLAYIVRPTNLIPLAVTAAWAVLTRPREVPAFFGGALAPLALFAWSNQIVYHAWLPPYFKPGFFKPNAYKAEALAGLLVSPNRGLLVFSPILALAAAGFAVKVYSRRATALHWSLAAIVLAHWVVLATTNAGWWGGASYGPRLFSDVIPYLVYLTLPFVAWLMSARGAWRAAVAAAVAPLVVISVAMHAQGALNPSAMAWNNLPVRIDFDPIRVWDWRRPQFLAGITFLPAPPPPVDLDAVACSAPPDAPGTPVVAANSGGTVVLQWTPSARPAAVYLVEVGSQPGAADMPMRESRDTEHPSVTAQRVPPGTYYVRVRGRNRCGDGPASSEVVVTIR